MGNADTIREISDTDLITELKRRASESSNLKKRALEALAEGEVRPGLKQALKGNDQPVKEGTEKRELSPDSPEATALLSTLKKRLTSKSVYRRPKGIEFSQVEAALKKRPDLMYRLAEIEKGGPVDIRAIEGDEFIFCDFKRETPEVRRNLTYPQVAEKAREMGVDVQSEAGWRALQELGVFDTNYWLWLESDDIIDTGYARVANRAGRVGDYPYVTRSRAGNHFTFGGWRAELRVPKA